MSAALHLSEILAVRCSCELAVSAQRSSHPHHFAGALLGCKPNRSAGFEMWKSCTAGRYLAPVLVTRQAYSHITGGFFWTCVCIVAILGEGDSRWRDGSWRSVAVP